MTQNVVKEVVQNPTTGQIAVEYSDDSGKEFNIDQVPVAEYSGTDVVLKVFGETLDIAGSASSAVSQAQALATISGDTVVAATP